MRLAVDFVRVLRGEAGPVEVAELAVNLSHDASYLPHFLRLIGLAVNLVGHILSATVALLAALLTRRSTLSTAWSTGDGRARNVMKVSSLKHSPTGTGELAHS